MIPEPPPGQGPIDPRGAFAGSPGAPPPSISRPMPAVMPPPYYYPPPPKPRGGFVRGVFTTLASSIFGFSILLNIYLLFAMNLTGSGKPNETVLVKGDANNQIAVIPIKGEINSDTHARINKLLRALKDDATIKAIVLEINTPGGEVAASDEIYTELIHFKQEKKIPIVVAMGAQATSGGYYIACAGDYIVAEPTTMTANIGVVAERLNFAGLLDKYGVKDVSITPAGAKYKYVESPFVPDTPETQAYLRVSVEQLYARFKSIVATSRKGKLAASIDVVADGRELSADDAMKSGLVDEINYADAAYAKAASLAGISNQQVVRYQGGGGLLDLISGADSTNSMKPATGNFPDLHIDRALLDELSRPRMMSIYRGG